jgi:hypothetical protein
MKSTKKISSQPFFTQTMLKAQSEKQRRKISKLQKYSLEKLFLIKTYSEIFDCIGFFEGFGKTVNGDSGYKVKVIEFLNIELSLKDQIYVNKEIKEVVEIGNAKAARILYGC